MFSSKFLDSVLGWPEFHDDSLFLKIHLLRCHIFIQSTLLAIQKNMDRLTEMILNGRYQVRENRSYPDCVDKNVIETVAIDGASFRKHPLRIIHHVDEAQCSNFVAFFQDYVEKLQQDSLNAPARPGLKRIRITKTYYSSDPKASACIIWVDKPIVDKPIVS